ncbi:MAG: hypothetical protein LBU23_06015 [Planctomycetota bacterium]|nr:hypothetical protein [Planctomycetota bacterium]
MSRKTSRLPAILSLALLAAPSRPAADMGGAAGVVMELPDVFVPGSGRPPRAGEWLEYRISFPVDPLENSLAENPLAAPGSEPSAPDGAAPEKWESAFDPPTIWLTLPLRLETLSVGREACRARLTFAGFSGEVDLPLAPPAGAAEFHYLAPQPADAAAVHRAGRLDLKCLKTRRRDNERGFVRLSSSDAPFGLLRFATADLDLALVGFGDGLPPAYPLPDGDGMDPPPGRLYREE